MRSSTKIVAGIVGLIVVMAVIGFAVVMLLSPSSSEPEPGIPELEFYTTDLAGVLTYEDLLWIDEVCYEVDDNSSCEMAVLVVNTTKPYDINYFTFRTFEHNGIGKSGRDNGVLIVVATEDQAWRVEVGYGLEGILTDVRVKHLAEQYLEPSMKIGAYADGLFYLTTELGAILEEEYEGDRSGDTAFELFGYGVSWTGVAIAVVVVVIVSIVTKGRALYPIIWILSLLGGRGGGFGGGRSGGGGASGRS